MIKNFIYSTLIGAFVFVLFYLLGSFFSVSFDISKWTDGTRFIICYFGGFISMLCLIISFLYNLNEKLKI